MPTGHDTAESVLISDSSIGRDAEGGRVVSTVETNLAIGELASGTCKRSRRGDGELATAGPITTLGVRRDQGQGPKSHGKLQGQHGGLLDWVKAMTAKYLAPMTWESIFHGLTLGLLLFYSYVDT